MYSRKSLRVILGFVGHTSSLSETPSPSKSSTHASPYVSPKGFKVIKLVGKIPMTPFTSPISNILVMVYNGIGHGDGRPSLEIKRILPPGIKKVSKC